MVLVLVLTQRRWAGRGGRNEEVSMQAGDSGKDRTAKEAENEVEVEATKSKY